MPYLLFESLSILIKVCEVFPNRKKFFGQKVPYPQYIGIFPGIFTFICPANYKFQR